MDYTLLCRIARSYRAEVANVAFICPIFQMYPAVISSLIAQTTKTWTLELLHNGPNPKGLDKTVAGFGDPRIRFRTFPTEAGNYGHPLRRWALEEMKAGRLAREAEHVVITNADNYHAPVFVERLTGALKANPKAVAAYCSQMVHSYVNWKVMNCSLARGYIDAAGVMIRRAAAVQAGWRSMEHSSDWTYFSDVIARHGAASWVKVEGCLLVHN